MKNNTAYLKKIPWLVLLGLIYGIVVVFLVPWLDEQFKSNSKISSAIWNSAFYIIIYAGIGIATLKWKEIAIALGIQLIITFLFPLLPVNSPAITWILYYLVVPVPLTVFISLQTGWQKKTFLLYFGVLISTMIFILAYYVAGGIYATFYQLHFSSTIYAKLTWLPFHMIAAVFHVIMICELLNFMRSDKNKPETLLLNLGNEYGKTQTFIAFWIFKSSLLMIAAAAAFYIKVYLSSNQIITGEDYDYREYFRVSGALAVTTATGLSLFGGWYLRKLLLEYFITYNIRFKFLYWLALIPLIGFLSFLFMETNQVKQQNYNQKVIAIGNFAGSGTTAITVISFMLLLLRVVFKVDGTGYTVYISMGIACLLFTWMIFSRAGYYANFIIILLGLACILTTCFLNESLAGELFIYFGVLLISLSQLVLFLPVYHFDKFFYTPAENPEAQDTGPRDIFA